MHKNRTWISLTVAALLLVSTFSMADHAMMMQPDMPDCSTEHAHPDTDKDVPASQIQCDCLASGCHQAAMLLMGSLMLPAQTAGILSVHHPVTLTAHRKRLDRPPTH